MATTTVYGCNTIATLVFHINYFMKGVLDFLNTGKLEIKDKFSFNGPSIQNEDQWQDFLSQTYKEIDQFCQKVSSLENTVLNQTFAEEKYGNYYNNLIGMLEHNYYHLGQIVIIKKILLAQEKSEHL